MSTSRTGPRNRRPSSCLRAIYVRLASAFLSFPHKCYLTPHLLPDGRALLIKAGSDFSNRPEAPKAALASLPEGQTKSKTAQALLAKQRNPVGCTLFVGNLGFEATEEAMRELIDAHWKTSLANNKRHAQKAVRSSFLPESESTVAGEEGVTATSGEADEQPVVSKKEESAEQLVGFSAGLRKVRMAQFQDSGKCKGYVVLASHAPVARKLELTLMCVFGPTALPSSTSLRRLKRRPRSLTCATIGLTVVR